MIHARVLGTAQDAGVPHVGCLCPRCERFRPKPLYPACLGLSGEFGGYLIDATPAIGMQLDAIPGPLRGIALTHVHMGHVAGLLQLGPEGMAVRDLPVYATPAVCDFLRSHAPWELLVRRGHLNLVEHTPGRFLRIDPAWEIEAIQVPHRNEYADTVGYLVRGRQRSLLYVPDVDDWSGVDLPGLVDRCDIALLDGTFYTDDEMPRQGDVPHPPITRTLELLDPERAAKVRFLHFNHTNPVLDEDGPTVLAAVQGDLIEL